MSGYLAHLEAKPATSIRSPSSTRRSASGLAIGSPNGALMLASGSRSRVRLVAADQERRLRKCLLHRLIARDMVSMAVRVEDGGQAQPVGGSESLEDRLGVESGIDHDGVVATLAPDDV